MRYNQSPINTQSLHLVRNKCDYVHNYPMLLLEGAVLVYTNVNNNDK